VSDRWAGIESLFVPGREILLASEPDEVLEILRRVGEDERRRIGERARARVLSEHTAAHRAEQLETYALETRTRIAA
jgi:spore maturation protein CgeB